MKKRILIVDDSASIRAATEFTLQAAGYDVSQAEDGKAGLEVLASLPSEELGMIITDINMPEMDGITFIKEIKKTEHKFVPILVLTTEAQDDKKQEGQDAGASGWLVKPFKSEQLVGVVKKFLG